MSVAPLIQLMSRGKQNDILNENPQITFWRYRHMKYTDFALEHINVTNGNGESHVALGPMTFDLPRSGDLVNDCFAVFRLPGIANVVTASDAASKYAGTEGGLYWDVEGRYVKSSSGTALSSQQANTVGYTQNNIHELIESEEHLNAYRQAAGDAACVLPGPQPYWCNGVGQAILTEVKLRVGSQYVDTLYSDYLYMWDELSDKPGRHTDSEGYGRMCMKGSDAKRKCWSQTTSDVYVPIPMFFMRTSGNALPLIALQFHGVQIVLTCSDPTKHIINSAGNKARDGIDSLFMGNNGMDTGTDLAVTDFKTVVRGTGVVTGGVDNDSVAATGSFLLCTDSSQDSFKTSVARDHCHVSLNVGYVYLNVTERNKFADASFEILIDQVQKNIDTEINQKTSPAVSLSINFMVQELIWACKRDSNLDIRHEPFNYRGEVDFVNGVARDPIESVQLRLNNSTRFNMNDGQDVNASYFRTVEPYLHHTRIPDNHIYSYSFALNPESEQPSGAINMSRIDNAKLSITMSDALPFSGKGYHVKDSLAREAANKSKANSASGGTNLLDYSQLTLRLFARNWNVFRVTLGLGGTKWAA